jgi:hypothetical protein
LKLILHIALSDEVLVVSSVEVVVLHQSVEFVESSVVPVVTHQSVESVDVDPVPPPPSARTNPVRASGVAAIIAPAMDCLTKFLRFMIFVYCILFS